MNRWLIAVALVMVTAAVGMRGFRIVEQRREQRRESARRVQVASCLKQLGQASLLYQRDHAPATQPTQATIPARSALIRGCSKNHDDDGETILYSDQTVVFGPTTNRAGDARFAEKPLLWPELRGGGMYIVLRHARTEGTGSDPANFTLADRATQRNLSDDGIAQAKRVGEILKQKGVPVGKVLSSEYFRCRDTAQQAFETFKTDPVLNSLQDEQQLAAFKKLLGTKTGNGNVVLVTHQANLKAATGIVPDMGHAVVVYPNPDGTYAVLGELRIEP